VIRIREAGAGGSNPLTPTIIEYPKNGFLSPQGKGVFWV
jgi:hypothetical protein